MSPPPGQPQHLLLYEPQVEGHHLVYLRHITETLLTAGFRLTLALDQRPQSQPRIEERLRDLLPRVTVIPARDQTGWFGGRGKADTVAACQRQSGAEDVFVCCLDEIASHCLRRAAFGFMPPPRLRGNLGGIYLRPRFLMDGRFSPNQWLKKRGFARLLRGGWFRRVLFLDEYLHAALKAKLPGAPFYFLPEPCPEFHGPDKARARELLGLPPQARIFLFYGGPYKRKGLDLAVSAMLSLPSSSRAFLFCVGPQPSDAAIARGLESLTRMQRAHSINRFVLAPEDELCFAACDAVLLPYRKHFGSSAVLSRAAAAGKPVIASDEELIGRRVREHNLGPLFPSGNADELRRRIEQIANMPEDGLAQWSQSATKYFQSCSPEAFRGALLQAFGRGFAAGACPQ